MLVQNMERVRPVCTMNDKSYGSSLVSIIVRRSYAARLYMFLGTVQGLQLDGRNFFSQSWRLARKIPSPKPLLVYYQVTMCISDTTNIIRNREKDFYEMF